MGLWNLKKNTQKTDLLQLHIFPDVTSMTGTVTQDLGTVV